MGRDRLRDLRRRGVDTSPNVLSGVALCTDSSSLLTDAEATRLGVGVVPIAVTLDGIPFDEEASRLDAFYERLERGAAATTSQPSPGELLAEYERLAAAGAAEILSIHLDRQLSGTAATAELASRNASIPVTVADVPTASFGVTLCVREATSRIAAGAGAREAGDAARRIGAQLQNVFVAPVAAGGRVPASRGWAALQLTAEGPELLASCAVLEEVVEAMTAVVVEDAPTDAAVGHAAGSVRSWADELSRRLAEVGVGVERYRVGAAVGAHTGPFSFGAFWQGRARPGRRDDAR